MKKDGSVNGLGREDESTLEIRVCRALEVICIKVRVEILEVDTFISRAVNNCFPVSGEKEDKHNIIS